MDNIHQIDILIHYADTSTGVYPLHWSRPKGPTSRNSIVSTGKEYDGIENTWLMTDDVTQVMRYNMVLHDAMWSGVVFHDIVFHISLNCLASNFISQNYGEIFLTWEYNISISLNIINCCVSSRVVLYWGVMLRDCKYHSRCVAT